MTVIGSLTPAKTSSDSLLNVESNGRERHSSLEFLKKFLLGFVVGKINAIEAGADIQKRQ